MPFNCSLDRDRGRVLRELDATLCVGPCTDVVNDALDMRSEAAASDCLDCLSSRELKCGSVFLLFHSYDCCMSQFEITGS